MDSAQPTTRAAALRHLLNQALAIAPDKPTWVNRKLGPTFETLYNKQRVYETWERMCRYSSDPEHQFSKWLEDMKTEYLISSPVQSHQKMIVEKSASVDDCSLRSRSTGAPAPVLDSATVSGPPEPKVLDSLATVSSLQPSLLQKRKKKEKKSQTIDITIGDNRSKKHGGKGRKQNPSRVCWVFRCNIDEGDIEQQGDELAGKLIPCCEKYAFQAESAPTTGYKHFQGYFELNNKNRFEWIQKHIHKFEYLSERKGTAKQAWSYAVKQETRLHGPWLLGEPTVNDSGSAKVLEQFVRAIEKGDTRDKLWEDFPSCMVRYHKTPAQRKFDMKPSRTEDLKVYVYYGPPGTGKSRTAAERYPTIYKVPFSKTGIWMTEDGTNVPEVLIEDFQGDMPLKLFNRIVDRYPDKVEIKGGYIWWCPNLIIITTNVLPSQWYPQDGRQDVTSQIFRRITGCYDFTGVKMDERDQLQLISVQDLCARYANVKASRKPLSAKEQYYQFKLAKLTSQQNMLGLNQQKVSVAKTCNCPTNIGCSCF